MPLTDAQRLALSRLQSFYEGDNPYNSVTNPGGLRQGGSLYNFVPALKDIATAISAAAQLLTDAIAASANSPKAVRVDSDQTFTDSEKAAGQRNLGIASAISSAVSKSGDTMTGVLSGPAFTATGASGAVNITGRDGLTTTILYNTGRSFRVYDAAIQSDLIQVLQDGSLWTKQLGDINTRIETRAKFYADNAQAATSGGVSKSGDTMTGALQITGDFPQLRFQRADKSAGWGFLAHTDGKVYLQTYNSAGGYVSNALTIGPDGSLSTAQLGDLNGRIEARARAFADAAQAAAISSANATSATKVAKTGDTMTGPLALSFGTPYLDLLNPNIMRVRFIVDGGGTLIIRNGDNADNFFYVTSSGAVWTKQFGDLNSRIEQRGADYGNDAVNRANGYTNGQVNARVHSGRFVYAGDLGNDWNIAGGFGSPYGGYGCVVDRATGFGNSSDQTIQVLRWRYLQLITNNQGWFTIGAAS